MNVACGERWSLLELVAQLESVLQCDIQVEFHDPRAGDIKHSLASIEQAKNLLGYVPTVDFDEGIRQTVAWFFNVSRNTRSAGTPAAVLAGAW
jgi:UDP-glucose 4-epimerase